MLVFPFSRTRTVLRMNLQLGPGGKCAVDIDPGLDITSKDQYKLFQTLYVTLVARLLYDAGPGEVAEMMLMGNRALFNDLLHKGTAVGFKPGECLKSYTELELVSTGYDSQEQHTVVLKRKKDNSVFCEIKSRTAAILLHKYGPWVLIKYGRQQFGERVYQDLSDALHRMNRFYRDMPYWGREGLYVVPRLTLGIMVR